MTLDNDLLLIRKIITSCDNFSEDLDFTSINRDFVLSKKLLEKIVSIVAERTEIPLHIQKLEQLKFKDKPTEFSAIVKFWGADHPRNLAPPPVQRWLTSIKIEVILYEEMVFSPETRTVQHAYSDKLSKRLHQEFHVIPYMK